MSKISFLFLISFIWVSFSFPQDNLLTVEDVVINSYTKLSPANLKLLNWIPKTNSYVYLDTRTNTNLLKCSIKSDKLDTILTLNELNKLLQSQNLTEINSFPLIHWIDNVSFNFWIDNKLLLYNLKTKKLALVNSIDDNAENKTIAPNSKYVAYTKANNLFVNLDPSKIIQITFEKDTNIVCGQAVHRNEFGIESGIFWSPNSNYIAFYRMDQTMVTDYPIIDISSVPARLKNIKYPMAGQTSHNVTVGIFDIKTNKTIFLKTGESLDQYLTCLTWSPDEKYFYIAHLNRDQNHLQLKKYDAKTGELIKILFEEKNEKYVEPENPLLFLPDNNSKFLWFSKRDGFKHLYLYDSDGNLIRQVTKGSWEVTNFIGFDESGKHILITSTKDSPLERHVYKINLETGETKKLTSEPGIHTIIPNFNQNYFLDSYTNLTTPRIINLINKKGEAIKNLLTADNPLKEYKIGKTKIFSIKNDEGIELFCRMILPSDFDTTKKYPVIVYIYGGPHAQEITNSFGYGRYFLWFYMMAQKGYIIFTLDNRGSANRGLEFEQATFRRLGTIEIKDQMSGINYLKTLSYIDTTRFGVFGWSYGGFMTTSLMLRTNNTFKVGVGGGAVIDWKFYEVMYTERYMDTPQANPEGYKESSLLNYVQNLNGKLLLIHGTFDPVVVWQNTLAFVQKATELNKPLDYFPYIGHGHGVTGKDALHLYTKITNYFLDNL
ncbi:MAG: S9 family peptidase [Melioribacter sp.]|uniref:S9 family peptidase n=1 Tax=Rosettibacter primus TaxID=3111523 RepID=UPI00247DA92B|nr:S9 family peptidase [Melioribacter sp.]